MKALDPLDDKQDELDRILGNMGSVLVAYSGGVDSSYLAVRAHRVLGSRSLAVTADSPSLAEDARRRAKALAAGIGFAHRMVETAEFDDPLYLRNAPDRCYRCKSELFRRLLPLAAREGFAHVAYGVILDDLSDLRPGHQAAAEAGVRSPLAEARLTKADVRRLSKALGLPTWDLPASPCLSSRVPYGTAVTPETLRRVERAESAVRAHGFREFRVRHLGETARLEVAPDELARLRDEALREAVLAGIRGAGYREVLVDPQGYRRGRLNEALPLKVVTAP